MDAQRSGGGPLRDSSALRARGGINDKRYNGWVHDTGAGC